MNVLAPPPKRPHGTGTVGQTYNGRWRYRLPGGRVERGGFATRAEAESALDAALLGHDWKLIELRKAVKRAVQIAHELGVDMGVVARSVRAELMIDDARDRRVTERTAQMAVEEKGTR